ncbi:hypothetical protein C1645_774806 [Glomus cerebriforme]|uniref:RNase H type-1 domain-containing protein n=1 Tax=Glomus cerebriforme TaxID=658196 RepID=A0A397SQU8_9GLOM|nr:hypothetical protein C1645_774806 [Glomus cerebriforme]
MPLSTKTEAFAIATALLTVPPKSTIKLFTDSANCNFRTLYRPVNRKKLKINNYHIWFLIQQLIKDHHLHISFVKVKGHSNNRYNEIADNLAKQGCSLNKCIMINPNFLKDLKAFNNFNNIGPIDKDVRKWTNTLFNSKTFNDMLNNKSMFNTLQITLSHDIDWTFTERWLKYNPTTSVTSQELRISYMSYKTKSFNHSLPTGDILLRNFPKLYPDSILNCPNCNISKFSNDHVFTCTSFLHIHDSFKNYLHIFYRPTTRT